MPGGFTSVNVNNNFIAAIQKFYRNPTEFVNVAVREKIEEIHRRQIDKRKLDAFFMRERQIRADHSTG
jgi:hypothetical protein